MMTLQGQRSLQVQRADPNKNCLRRTPKERLMSCYNWICSLKLEIWIAIRKYCRLIQPLLLISQLKFRNQRHLRTRTILHFLLKRKKKMNLGGNSHLFQLNEREQFSSIISLQKLQQFDLSFRFLPCRHQRVLTSVPHLLITSERKVGHRGRSRRGK